MIWLIFFGVFTLLASTGVSYLWWIRVREMRFRQDIFSVRDDLFDLAVASGLVDDPAYIAFREYLNNMLLFAHHLSIPVMVHMAKFPLSSEPFPRSENKCLQRAIEDATTTVSNRIVRFLRYETMIGLVVELATRVAEWAKPAGRERISAWIAPGHLPSSIIRIAY